MKSRVPVLILACLLVSFAFGRGAGEQLLERIPPRINAAQALQQAEKYVSEKKLDVSQRFISSVRYIESGSWTKSYIGNGPYWQVTWELVKLANGGQYFVMVYMDGKVGHIGGR